jgi:uncharacterized iron-regulated membrane protein
MTPAFWRRWHRWLGLSAALFLLFAATTGFFVAGTEFFGEAEAKREALRDVVSPVTASAPATLATVDSAIGRALATVASTAGNVPIDRVTLELKGDEPVVSVFTGKPTGGEDRKYVLDARTGRLITNEAYADKPFLYRLHSGEAFGDGGLVLAMGWALALVWLTISGLNIYWRMRRRNATGLQKVFW